MNDLPPTNFSFQSSNFWWDLFCSCSLIGIWPRFIEPQITLTSQLVLPIPSLPNDLRGFKILQISDLHLHPHVPDRFLDHVLRKINRLRPDLIAITGDFLCYARMTDPTRLYKFLKNLHAPYGSFAVLGNHDYAECVSINSKGEYDIVRPSALPLSKAFKRLRESVVLKKSFTDQVKDIPLHPHLIPLLKETSFQLLHNQTITVPVKKAKLNICGLGEYMLNRLDPKEAFKNYNENYPGIILLHNHDGVKHLEGYPGQIVLSGHTHGGQVNLPWMWKKFTLLENMKLKKGLVQAADKLVYVNRGLGSILPFRWFSPPELLLLTLESKQ